MVLDRSRSAKTRSARQWWAGIGVASWMAHVLLFAFASEAALALLGGELPWYVPRPQDIGTCGHVVTDPIVGALEAVPLLGALSVLASWAGRGRSWRLLGAVNVVLVPGEMACLAVLCTLDEWGGFFTRSVWWLPESFAALGA